MGAILSRGRWADMEGLRTTSILNFNDYVNDFINIQLIILFLKWFIWSSESHTLFQAILHNSNH